MADHRDRPPEWCSANGRPLAITRNGGTYYGWRRQDHVEGRYPIVAPG